MRKIHEERKNKEEGEKRSLCVLYTSVYVGLVMRHVPLTFFLRSNLVREEALKKAGVPVGGPLDEEKEDDGASNTSSCSIVGRRGTVRGRGKVRERIREGEERYSKRERKGKRED